MSYSCSLAVNIINITLIASHLTRWHNGGLMSGNSRHVFFRVWTQADYTHDWWHDHVLTDILLFSANTRRWTNVVLMLVRRRRRWTSIKPTLGRLALTSFCFAAGIHKYTNSKTPTKIIQETFLFVFVFLIVHNYVNAPLSCMILSVKLVIISIFSFCVLEEQSILYIKKTTIFQDWLQN